MIKSLAVFSLVAMVAAGLPASHPFAGDLIQAGLSDEPAAAPAPGASPAPAETPAAPAQPPPAATASPDMSAKPDMAAALAAASCTGVTFTRSVKYGAHNLNVLDAATTQTRPDARRPVVVFVAGDSFADGGDEATMKPLVERAMCFAANRGLVAFHVSYRVAPAATWPAAAKDVGAAISWIYENADLFGGNAQEIIPIGYGTGAFHVASFLAHKEFQEKDDHIAGAVLLSGVYRPASPASEGDRAYFGADTSTYDSRSAIPGLTEIEEPIVLAWSQADAPRFIAQGKKLKEMLCDAGHCPRTSVLTKPTSPASVFDLDGESTDLHERLRQLIGQIDARGLP